MTAPSSVLARPARRARTGSRRRSLGWFATPGVLFLLAVFLVPLALLAPQSLSGGTNGAAGAAYRQLLTEPVYRDIVANTAKIALWTTLWCTVLGYPLAVWASRLGSRARAVVIVLVVLPFWVSILVRTYSWMVILGKEGLVNRALMALGIVDAPVSFLFEELGVLIGTVNLLAPFFILPMFAVMSGIDPRMLPAAESLGASRTQAFWRVWFPQTVPALLGSAFLVFILTFGFYVTPAILGGGRVQMLATLLDTLVNTSPNWPLAAALSVSLLLVVLILYWVSSLASRLARRDASRA